MSDRVRTPVTLSETWSGTIAVTNPSQTVEKGALASIRFSTGAGGCEIAKTGVPYAGPPQTPDPDPVHNPPWWVGIYHNYTVTVGTQSATFAVWMGDQGYPGLYVPPSVPIVVGDLEVTCTAALSGVHARSYVEANDCGDRYPLDYTDYTGGHVWWADENATVTFTATCPDGTTLTRSGPLAEGLVELGPIVGALAVGFTTAWCDDDYTGTVYGVAKNCTFNGEAVDWSKCVLYEGGTDVPDSAYPTWGRTVDSPNCWRIGPSGGGVGIWRDGNGSATGATWAGTVQPPLMVRFKAATGAFDDETAYSITVGGTPARWNGSMLAPITWAGDLEVVEQECSWYLPSDDWQRMASYLAHVEVDSAWRVANQENVVASGSTEGEIARNDRACALLMHPVNATYEGDPRWGPFLSVMHETECNVRLPNGQRPSNWIGTGGATPQSNNDIWIVTAGSSAPAVTRTFKTRKWLRLDRLSGGYIEGETYLAEWVIMNRANISVLETADDAAWQTAVPYEDIRDWSNFCYLRLGIDAPKAGNITLTVNCSQVTVEDNCSTSAEERWGGFSYTRTPLVYTYTFAVVAGSNSVIIDLCLPTEGVIPNGDNRQQHVDSIRLSLPAAGTTNETWTLTDLALVLDPDRSDHCELRYVRSWDWYNTDWFGFGTVTDGKDTSELDYGYECQDKEHKHSYIRHVVSAGGTSWRLDTLKPLVELANEISWQEGWRATHLKPEASAQNVDNEKNILKAPFHWFDLRHAHKWETDGAGATAMQWGRDTWGGTSTFATNVTLDGAVAVGSIYLVAGVWQDIYYSVYPRGRIHGIARDEAGATRLRSWTGVVAGGSTLTTDTHGRYVTTPLTELGGPYTVGSTSVAVTNREYSTLHSLFPLGGEFDLRRDFAGRIWCAYTVAGKIMAACWPDCLGQDGSSYTVTADAHWAEPSICPLKDGSILIAAQDTTTGLTAMHWSQSSGSTWAEKIVAIGAGLSYSAICEYLGTGAVYLVGYASGAYWIEWTEDKGATLGKFLDGSTRKKVCDATSAQQPGLECWPDGILFMRVYNGSTALSLISKDRGNSWATVA